MPEIKLPLVKKKKLIMQQHLPDADTSILEYFWSILVKVMVVKGIDLNSLVESIQLC